MSEQDKLAPLPEARWLWAGKGPRPYEDAYSADQMHAYAAAAVAAAIERCAVLVETQDTYGDHVGCWFETLAAKIRASAPTK